MLELKTVFFLCFAVAVYSTSGIFTKLASGQEFLSLPYLLCLSGVVAVLGTYAVLWQMALKRVSLNQAYMFRSLGLVYSVTIAVVVFGESVSLQNIAGCALVMIGLGVITSGQTE